MNRAMVGVAGVIGVVLAVLLMWLPFRGTDGVEDLQGEAAVIPTEANQDPLTAEASTLGENKRPEHAMDKPMRRPGLPPLSEEDINKATGDGDFIEGPNPIAAEMQALRDTPEGRAAANMDAPFNRIKQLLSDGSGGEAKAQLAKDCGALVGDLRHYRRMPDPADWPNLETRIGDLSKRVKDGGYNNGEVAEMLSLVEERTANYHAEADEQ